MKTKKNVLLIVRFPVGGIRTFIKYVYKKEYFDQYKFTLILSRNHLVEQFEATNFEVNFDFIVCEDNAWGLFKAIIRTVRSTKFDLLHSHGFTSAFCTALIAKFYSIPHLLTAHDVILEKQFAGIKGEIKKRIISVVFNKIDVIQAVTEDASNNFKEMLPWVTTPRTITIVNGINVDQYKISIPRDIRREFNLSTDIFLIGFFGRFMSQKGFKYLVNAIEKIVSENLANRSPLVIAVGHGGFIREEKEVIVQKGLDNHFLFLDAVNDIGPTLKALDVVAMPSLWESCGLVAMETLAAGVPLIASNCVGLREVIASTPTFVVEPADTESLCDTIVEVIQNNSLEKFQDYQEIACQRFDSRTNARELSELYTQLVNNQEN